MSIRRVDVNELKRLQLRVVNVMMSYSGTGCRNSQGWKFRVEIEPFALRFHHNVEGGEVVFLQHSRWQEINQCVRVTDTKIPKVV